MRFPFIGSLSLVSLFVMFKLLPVDAVNFVLSFYFLIIGCVATTATVLPLVQGYFSETLREKRFGPYKPRLSDSIINLIPSERLRAEIRSAQVLCLPSIHVADSCLGRPGAGSHRPGTHCRWTVLDGMHGVHGKWSLVLQ